jgi:glutamate racemase
VDGRPIGIFDSGVGGLTIWSALRALLPHEALIYLADRGFFPYGDKAPEDLRERSVMVTRALLRAGSKLVVVACNTATVAALAHLRAAYPDVPFVGVVPVVKVLAERTRTGTIAILSTPGTAASPYLADLLARFAAGCTVVNVGCAGLAEAIESCDPHEEVVNALLDRYLRPVQESGADMIGLGCTHYPFAAGRIRAVLGEAVAIVDSAQPVARRVRAVLDERQARAPVRLQPVQRFLTTGDAGSFTAVAQRLLALDLEPAAHIDLDTEAPLQEPHTDAAQDTADHGADPSMSRL